MPTQTDDHPDNLDTPDGVVPYPSLSFHAVRWLNQRSGGASGGYPDLPKVLTPVFYDQVDPSQPVAVLRTHREEAIRHHLGITNTEGQLTTRVIELLVAICSFAPKEPGPRLINELVCHPADYDRVVGLTTLPGRTPREYHTLKQHGMFGGTMADPPEARPET